MRCNRLLLGAATALLFAAAVYFLVIRKEHAGDPLSFLPGNTLALVDLRQPAAQYAALRKSLLGQRVSSIRWTEFLRQFGAGEVEPAVIQESLDQVQAFLEGPLFKELFHQRAVLALLPPDPRHTGHAPWDSLLLIASPKHRAKAVELLAQYMAADSRYVIENYQGREIWNLVLSDRTALAVASSNDLILASPSTETLKRCLEASRRQAADGAGLLVGNPGFMKLRQRAGGQDEQFVYADLGALTRLLGTYYGNVQANEDKFALTDEGGPGQGAFFCGTRQGIMSCKALLTGDPGRGEADKEQIVDPALAAVPADILLHCWTNLLDLGRIDAVLHRIPELREQIDRVEDWLALKTGMSSSQLLSMIGDQFSLTVTAMDAPGIFPLPRMCCRLSISDDERIRQALASIMEGRASAFRDVAGSRIHTLILGGGLLQPSWAIRDGTLFIADKPEQIEQAFLPPEALLIDTPRFRQIGSELERPSSMIFYVNYPGLIDWLQQFLSWGATIMTMIDQERGGRVRSLVDLAVLPVLDGLRMFAAGSGRLCAEASEWRMDSVMVLADQNEVE